MVYGVLLMGTKTLSEETLMNCVSVCVAIEACIRKTDVERSLINRCWTGHRTKSFVNGNCIYVEMYRVGCARLRLNRWFSGKEICTRRQTVIVEQDEARCVSGDSRTDLATLLR